MGVGACRQPGQFLIMVTPGVACPQGRPRAAKDVVPVGLNPPQSPLVELIKRALDLPQEPLIVQICETTESLLMDHDDNEQGLHCAEDHPFALNSIRHYGSPLSASASAERTRALVVIVARLRGPCVIHPGDLITDGICRCRTNAKRQSSNRSKK